MSDVDRPEYDLVIHSRLNGGTHNNFVTVTNIPPNATADNCYIELSQFQCFNNFHNISAALGNNVLKLFTSFANGAYIPINVTIPDGNYTTTSLFAYLNGTGTNNILAKWVFPRGNTTANDLFKTATADNGDTFQGVYIGAGYDPTLKGTVVPTGGATHRVLTANLPVGHPYLTEAVLPFTWSAGNVLTLNPPPADVYYKTYVNGNTIHSDPLRVNYFGLIDDAETDPLLRLLGFKTDLSEALLVPKQDFYGIYVNMFEKQSYNTTPVPQIPAIYGRKAFNLAGVSTLHVCTNNLSTQTYSNNSVLNTLNCLAVVPITVGYGEIVDYRAVVGTQRLKVDTKETQQLSFVVLDQELRPVDFLFERWIARLRFTYGPDASAARAEQRQGGGDYIPPNRNFISDNQVRAHNETDRFGNGRRIFFS